MENAFIELQVLSTVTTLISNVSVGRSDGRSDRSTWKTRSLDKDRLNCLAGQIIGSHEPDQTVTKENLIAHFEAVGLLSDT
jgi:hypothetical protein